MNKSAGRGPENRLLPSFNSLKLVNRVILLGIKPSNAFWNKLKVSSFCMPPKLDGKAPVNEQPLPSNSFKFPNL